jgi:hypothetical protein
LVIEKAWQNVCPVTIRKSCPKMIKWKCRDENSNH